MLQAWQKVCVRVSRLQVVRFRWASSFVAEVTELRNRATQGYFQSVNSFDVTPKKTVLLLHPPGACSAFTRSGSQYPPLGLNQLKALINDTQQVDVLEADGLGLTIEETVDAIRLDAPQAIGMTVTCGTRHSRMRGVQRSRSYHLIITRWLS